MALAVEQALELIRDRRPDSIDKAIALLQNTVYSFSMKVCGHPQDAEDTMQDVLLKSLPHLPKFENPRALAVWLYKTARNRCISSRRGEKHSAAKHVSLDELMPDSRELAQLVSRMPGPEAAALNRESAEHLGQAILAVPPAYRLVLVLHDMEELSTAEIAQITGLREGTVRVRLHRARLLVRRYLAELANRTTAAGVESHAAAGQRHPQRCRRLFAALSDYLDGVVDDAVCEEMDRHIDQCKPCQAFLASLKEAVAKCRSYSPKCDEQRQEELRRELLQKYQQAVAGLHQAQDHSLPA